MSNNPKSGVRTVLEFIRDSASSTAENVVNAVSEKLDDLTGETDRLRQKLRDDRQALQQMLDRADAVKPILPHFEAPRSAYLLALDAYQQVEAAADPRPALAALADLEETAQTLAAFSDEHALQNQAMLACAQWRGEHGAELKLALEGQDHAKPLQGLRAAVTKADNDFTQALAKPDFIEAQGHSATLSGALSDLKLAHDGLEQARLKLSQDYTGLAGLPAALSTASLTSGMATEHAALVKAHDEYNVDFKDSAYDLAEGKLKTLAERLNDFVKARDEEDKLRQQIESERKGLDITVEKAKGVTPVAKRFADLIPAFAGALNTFELADKGLDLKATRKAQEELKLAAEPLALLRDEHDLAAAAKKAVDSWQKTHGTKLAECLQLDQVTPEVRAQLRVLRPLNQLYESHQRAEAWVEAEACQPKLDTVLQAMGLLKGPYDTAALEKKKTDDERLKLEVRYQKVNNIPRLNDRLTQLADELKAADANYEMLYYGGRYAEATQALQRLELAIAGLEGASVEAEELGKKEEKARKDRAAAQEKLNEVAAIKGDTKQLADLWADAGKLKARAYDEYLAKQYDDASATAAEIIQKALAIKAAEGEMLKQRAAREKMLLEWNGLQTDLQNARSLGNFTSQLVVDRAAMDKGVDAFANAYNGLDNDAAALALKALPALIKAVNDAKSAHDEAQLKFAQAEKLISDLGDTLTKAQNRLRFAAYDDELKRLDAEWDLTWNRYQDALKAPDADEALRAATAQVKVIEAVSKLPLKDLRQARDATVSEITKEWKALKSQFGKVKAYQPVTDELRLLLDRLNAEAKDFDDSGDESRFADQLAALNKMKKTVADLEKIDYDKAFLQEKTASSDQWTKTVRPEYNKALKVPADTALIATLQARLKLEFGELQKSGKPAQPALMKQCLQQMTGTIGEINQAKLDNEKALVDFKKAFDLVLPRYNVVAAFQEGMDLSLDSAIQSLPAAYDAAVDAYDLDDGLQAMQHLPAYEKNVEALWNGRVSYQAAVDCLTELRKLDPGMAKAADLYEGGTLDGDFAAPLETFGAAWDDFWDTYDQQQYPAAVLLAAPGAALDLAAKELLKVVANKGQSAVDTLAQERKDVLAAWKLIRDDYDKVLAYKPFTPDIKKEQTELRKAKADFSDAVDVRYAYAEALVSAKAGGALFEAIKKLLDRKVEYDNLTQQAELTSKTAGDDIDNTDVDDLKKKKPDEKVKLLKDLQAQMQPPPSKEAMAKDPALKLAYEKQRAREFKVLRSMGLDADFVKEDERRKDELVRQMRENPELKEAKKDWNGKPPMDTKKRIAALRQAVSRQCALFGIDVPPIKEFSDPGNKSGIENGYFDPSTGAIFVNTHPRACLDNFEKALDLVIHENAHNFQFELVRRLEAGEIKPGDPDYGQALMFAANAGLYITPDEAHETEKDLTAYQEQPMEMHSFKTGPDVAKAFLK